MSGELWFAEGFTSYYDDLTLKRAEIIDLDAYAVAISGALDATLNAPGRELFSPVGMSQRAPFVDAAVSVDPTNQSNIYLSYYRYGTVVALGLDLSIRRRFPGKSLDDFMRAAWLRFGKPEIPYVLSDLEAVLAEVTGNTGFAEDFFARYIYDSELPDYEALMELGGLELGLAREGAAWLGISVESTSGAVTVSSTVRGGPAYAAGIDRGDVIRELAGETIGSEPDLERVLASLEPGDAREVVFDKRGEERRRRVVLEQDPRLQVVTFERAGREATPAIVAFRRAWLTSQADRER
jgi:predicted metalloprotease with PDZ domain